MVRRDRLITGSARSCCPTLFRLVYCRGLSLRPSYPRSLLRSLCIPQPTSAAQADPFMWATPSRGLCAPGSHLGLLSYQRPPTSVRSPVPDRIDFVQRSGDLRLRVT